MGFFSMLQLPYNAFDFGNSFRVGWFATKPSFKLSVNRVRTCVVPCVGDDHGLLASFARKMAMQRAMAGMGWSSFTQLSGWLFG